MCFSCYLHVKVDYVFYVYYSNLKVLTQSKYFAIIDSQAAFHKQVVGILIIGLSVYISTPYLQLDP
jgi:hypothetical protein